jgi:hypothetical protein
MDRSLDNDVGSPDDDAMRERLEKLEFRMERFEQRMAALAQDVAVIRANYATREVLHREMSAQTWRLVTFVCGFGTVLVSATYFIVNHAR